ncbi:MAG: hypothetical protein ACD_7C00279G0008 [uncultured bacterium]|nr:MAG: hypothetical protein ACD_7C00279G0008 [uncultured bacterium]HBR79744.1 hypothetical protein [Candidatus Moranbacteria bacterium]
MRNFLKTKFNRIKNSSKNPFKRTFGKIGLFLIFGMTVLNVSVNVNEQLKKNNYLDLELLSININSVNAELPENWWEVQDMSGSNYTIDPEKVDQNNSIDAVLGGNPFKAVVIALLNGINVALSKLVIFAGYLMDLALKQSFFNALIGNEGVYDGWVIVRDMLNMFFMLILLFSAFATIFQVEKYHLRKMIIMLVVMALLVNFSFPITRFIIDFSNSAMYFLVDNVSNSTKSNSAMLADFASFGEALGSASDMTDSIAAAILSLILTFITAITIFAFALNLLIRLLAFVILIILSPAGFVFAFFPGTKNIADDWWGALFKYSFMGPIMMFFFYLAIMMFKKASGAAAGESAWVVSFVKFFVPVVFLWMGLVASQKFGGAASGAAMNFAKKTGNNIKSYGQKAAWGTVGLAGKGIDAGTGHRISGGIGGLKSKWDSWGENYKTASNTRKTEAAAFLGVDGANEKLVRENMKKMKEEGISDADLNTKETSGTNAERMAVALFRAENNRFDNNPALAQTQYNNAMNAVRGHQVYENQFLGGARKTNMDLVINERITTSGANTPAAMQPIIRDELSRLDPDQWRDQNIQRMVANTTPNRGLIIAEGANIISGYSQQGQDNVTRNMRGAKLNAGSQGRNMGVGFWA